MGEETQPATKPEENAELIRQFLNLQARHIKQKANETDRLRERDRNHTELAKESLKAQVRDFEKNREHQRKQSIITKVFVAFIVVLSLGFVLYVLHSGHIEFAGKILEISVPFVGGGAGGYFLGFRKAQKLFGPNQE